jgi:hypothetical protein
MPEEKQQPAETPAVKVEEAPKENFEAKYKEAQAEMQKVTDQLKQSQGTLNTLEEYGCIDWNKLSQNDEPPVTNEPDNVATQYERRLQSQEGRLLTLQFRVENPDLKQFEDDLVVPFVLKARQQNPRKSQEEILKAASSECRAFLKKHRDAIEAEQKKAKTEEDKLKVSGLETGNSTTPEEQTVDEQKSREDYIAQRRALKARRLGRS